jgi:hypothetical protein
MDQCNMDYLINRFRERGLEPSRAQINLFCKLVDTFIAEKGLDRLEACYRAFWRVAKL